MQKILIICPCFRDRRELLAMPSSSAYSFIFHDFISDYLEEFVFDNAIDEGRDDNILNTIDQIIDTYKNDSLSGVIASDDYPGSTIASVVAKELQLPGPDPRAVLLCQHKYYSRVAQQKYVPEAVPAFSIVDPLTMKQQPPPLPFPFFIKPVKSYFSCNANMIKSLEDLLSLNNHVPSQAFFKPFNQLLSRYTDFKYDGHHLIAEELMTGHQCTFEGCMYHGKMYALGVVDSIMYPGTMSFKRFEYPSSLPQDVQQRMESISSRCMQGMGFDNGMFNIEFFYDADNNTLKIIEINPRMASQFADLYEKVDGTNSYQVALDIATGKPPKLQKRQGYFQVAASCALRTFEDKVVHSIPDEECIKALQQTYPYTRIEIFGKKGYPLSHELQDGKSYRYAIVNLGANSKEEMDIKLSKCISKMNIQLK